LIIDRRTLDASLELHVRVTVGVKGVDLTGLLGKGIKEDWEFGERKSPSGIQGRSSGRVVWLLLDKINLA